ncbi:MAG: hypothetical protein IT208_09055 [Chthonomonadales bacterium]|nr:hypothetical protein [Chthonomonadales bacterium]
MKTLGLDLGAQSIGWALVEDVEADLPGLRAGVYVFPEAGDLEDGLFESHRRQRGDKRRMRRNLRRRRERRDALLRLLLAHGMLPADTTPRQALFSAHTDADGRGRHPYALRKRGLDDPLTLHELGRALFHIARHRGYLSTALLKLRGVPMRSVDVVAAVPEERPAPEEAEEVGAAERQRRADEGGMLQRISEVRERLKAGEARTIGEFYADRLALREPVRGAGAEKLKKLKARGIERDALGYRADRAMFEEEFDRLWAAQSPHHPQVLTPALQSEIRACMFDQRPLRSAAHLVRRCEFRPRRRCAPRASLLAQRSVILQYLATLWVQTPGAAPRRLTGAEVCLLAEKLDRCDHLTWNQARDALALADARFSDEPREPQGRKGRSGSANRGRRNLRGNRTASVLRKALSDRWDALSSCAQEDLVTRLVTCRSLADVAPGLRRDFGLTDAEMAALASAELPEGYANHCSAVLRALEPWLRQGCDYWQACVQAGFRQEGESTEPSAFATDRLPPMPDLRNPMVQRAVEATRRVINAVIDRHGKPDRIRIELPRDVSRTNAQRERMWQDQDRNARERDAARRLLEENQLPLGHNEQNVRKVRLWQEAGCRCPYLPDQIVTIQQLVDDYDVDHIVPRSRCYDDSWMNTTICPRDENTHRKGRQTPYEAYGATAGWGAIEQYVNGLRSMPYAKRQPVLRKEWSNEEFTNRALSDTRYVSRVILRAVKALGVEVTVSTGRLTDLLRGAWELGECVPVREQEQAKLDAWRQRPVKKTPKPRHDHRHHAVDAIITALVDRGTLQRVSAWLKEQEEGRPRRDIPRPKPWATLRDDVRRAVNACPVVHQPTRGVGGPLHKETARKPPTRAEVEAALAALPAAERERVRRCVVVDKQLVWMDENGQPTKAYDLESNHHAVIWEAETAGRGGDRAREVEIVPMIEAARRARDGEPLIRAHRAGWRYVMALCKNDLVEWTGETPGLKRVAAISRVAQQGFEIVLAPPEDAIADGARRVRVRGKGDLRHLARRVCLDPLGEQVGQEPAP